MAWFTSVPDIAAPLAVFRRLRPRGRSVIQVLVYLGFVLLGLLLAAAFWWWLGLAWRIVQGSALEAPRLGTVTIVGADDANLPDAEATAAVLPQLIAVQLEARRVRINRAIDTLARAAAEPASHAPATPTGTPLPGASAIETTIETTVVPMSTDVLARLGDPGEAVSPEDLPLVRDGRIEIDVQVGGVDVGSMIRLIEAHFEPPKIDFVVSVQAGGRFRIYALASDTRQSFLVEAEAGPPDRIAEAIAGALLKSAVARREPVVDMMDLPNFEGWVDVLESYARARDTARITGDGPALYTPFAHQIATIAEAYPGWMALQWLALQIGERADDCVLSLASISRIEALDETVDEADRARIARSRSAVDARCAPARPARPGDTTDPADETWRLIAAAIRMPPGATGAGLRIGVLGAGDADLPGLHSEHLVAPAARSDEARTESTRAYFTSLLDAMRRIAPEATYVLSGHPPGFGASVSELLAEAELLLDTGRIDVMVTGMQPTVASEPFDELIHHAAARGVAVVLAAGHHANAPSVHLALIDVALIAGAQEIGAHPAPFSSIGEGLVWAPGNQLPLAVGPGRAEGELLYRDQSGTGFSAAIVAAAAAVVAERTGARGEALRAAIAEAAAARSEDIGLAVLDVTGAIERLRAP